MVEKTPAPTQLPVPSPAEETKECTYMHGSLADLQAAMKKLLAEVPLNNLETGLLEHFLAAPQSNVEKIVDTLQKARVRLADDRRAVKHLDRVLPLFAHHDFWSHQPVMRVYRPIEANQPIETRSVAEISTEALSLPAGYEWANVDMGDEGQAQELYTLLSNHYVEDDGGNFRFDYSVAFLKWALTPPGFRPDWIIGVRGGKDRKLFGFISGIPVRMTSHGRSIEMAEINFLCVHKKLRAKRLAPVLIQEVTRRVNLTNVWQAIYTAGATLPTPFGVANYWHRNLNPAKTVEVGFAYKPAN